jgi:hypothetical protein
LKNCLINGPIFIMENKMVPKFQRV